MERGTRNINFKKLLLPLLVFAILLLGAYLRLYRIADYLTFLGDEGRDVLVVKRMIVDHKLTLLGPTASVGGFFLGPIYYYFMLPFLWLFKLDPVGPAVMVALFGILTIFLVYKVGKDLFNLWAGLLAALLFTLSPLVIAYSRASWNPNLVPFFSTLFIYLLWLIVEKQKWSYLFLLGIVLGIGLQLHYLFVFLVPVAFIYFLIYGRNFTKIKYYFLAILGFLVGFSPFLAFELRHGFTNLQTVIKFIFSSGETGFTGQNFLVISWDVLFRLFGRLVSYFPNSGSWLTYFVMAVTLPIFFYLFLKKNNKARVLLFLWLTVGVFLFGFYKKPIYDYYFGFMFSLPFLLVGQTASFFLHFKYRPVKIIALLFVGILAWINWEGRPFKFTPNRQLLQTKTISRFVLDKTNGQPFNFALITGQNSDHAYRYFFEIWGNKPVTIENQEVDPQRKTVTSQLLVICEVSSCQPLGHSLWEIAGFGRAEIEGEWQVSVVRVVKLGHYKGE
ncbi:MAG: glycosyltransferase family 39 protein [Patescibacteria group bacterium]|nr:glycosyltransferase family 39 protein [Patescibacteria group bacterium]MCL5095204.1 glycosyltransferase family 39 protein [Patescibacteria group bacterium]